MVHVVLAALLAQVTPPPPPPVLNPVASPTSSAEPSTSSSESPSPSPSASPSPTPLVVTPATVDLHPGAQTSVHVAGATGQLTVTQQPRLVTVAVDQTTATLLITASGQRGTGMLQIVDEAGHQATVPLRVLYDAGTIAPDSTLKVTGSPVDPAWLARQVAALIARLTQAQVGAQATITPVTPPPSPLPPGAQTQFAVPVQISGNGAYFDVSRTATVTVQNVPLDPFTPAVLFYDDDPERITQDGVLYRGTITSATPVRLYYYHDAALAPRRVVVALSAQSQDPASVQVIDSSAGPNLDVMSVGHAVSKNFLTMKASNEGVILDLDGDTPSLLHDLLVQPREGAAGSLGLRVLQGGPVTVTVLALSPGVDPRTLIDAPQLPDDGHHRTGVFDARGYGTDQLSYAVGAPDAKVVYGDRQPTPQNVDPQHPGHDYGDYGVLHTILFTLTNPSAAAANVYLYERPIGGIVRSSFLVDNALIDVGCVRLPIPYQIAAYTLAPNQTYRVVLQTMTDGGSNYPLEVGVTTTAPQPSAPPISSADGCFPKPQPAPSTSPSATPAPSPSAHDGI